MKKLFLFAALAATVFASCGKNEVTQKNTAEKGTPVSFGVYAGKAATKAVSNTDPFGDIDTDALKAASSTGFGVFGYYTDNADYTSGSYYANFMYNEQVTYNTSTSKWEYDPVKYWPNEHGASANSETRVDKLTFMAYAPWVDIKVLSNGVPSTVKDAGENAATEGIINMTGNAMEEDATLSFVVPSSSAEQIDLLYGRLKTQSENVDDTNEPTVAPAAPDYSAIANLTKEKVGGKVDIIFKHALAKVTLDIKDVIDKVSPESSVSPATTKVFVKSLTIKGTNLGTSGKLNLYNGNWSDQAGAATFAVSPLPTSIYQASAPADGAAYDALTSVTGVIETGLGAATSKLMFVPYGTITGIDIVYYVCTRDANLATGISVVENHIIKDFDIDPVAPGNQPINLADGKGKQHNITILLGLTSVKLQASVDTWTTGTYSIDLPQNVE